MRAVGEEEQEEQEELRWKEARRKTVISQYIHPCIRDEMKEARKQTVRGRAGKNRQRSSGRRPGGRLARGREGRNGKRNRYIRESRVVDPDPKGSGSILVTPQKPYAETQFNVK